MRARVEYEEKRSLESPYGDAVQQLVVVREAELELASNRIEEIEN